MMKLFFRNYHKLERDTHIDQQFRATRKLDHRVTFPLASCHVAFLYSPLVSPAGVPQQIKRLSLQARDWPQAFQKRHLEGCNNFVVRSIVFCCRLTRYGHEEDRLDYCGRRN
jgi:hypothetical protein